MLQPSTTPLGGSPYPAHLAGQVHDQVHAMPRPAPGGSDPLPGGNIPSEVPPMAPDDLPDTGPSGPRSPYPVSDPGISDPGGPGSEPDYLPGRPTSPMQL